MVLGSVAWGSRPNGHPNPPRLRLVPPGHPCSVALMTKIPEPYPAANLEHAEKERSEKKREESAEERRRENVKGRRGEEEGAMHMRNREIRRRCRERDKEGEEERRRRRRRERER